MAMASLSKFNDRSHWKAASLVIRNMLWSLLIQFIQCIFKSIGIATTRSLNIFSFSNNINRSLEVWPGINFFNSVEDFQHSGDEI